MNKPDCWYTLASSHARVIIADMKARPEIRADNSYTTIDGELLTLELAGYADADGVERADTFTHTRYYAKTATTYSAELRAPLSR